MDEILNNMGPCDPFKELTQKNAITEKITIHVVQRKTRKYITAVEGLEYHEINAKSFLKDLRKRCSCNGNYDKEKNAVQFQGNQKADIVKILTEEYGVDNDSIILRGI